MAKNKKKVILTPEMRNQLLFIQVLQSADSLYTVMSGATHLPFVTCDDDTADDQVCLFLEENAAKVKASQLKDQGFAVGVVSIPKDQRQSFLGSLIPIGVNSILLQDVQGGLKRQELSKIIKRDQKTQLIENPEFVLTAIYLIQYSKNTKTAEYSEEKKNLQEEMMVHFREGRFLSPIREDGGLPLLKNKDGKALQPLFTDLYELEKFRHMNPDAKWKVGAFTPADLAKTAVKEAVGFAVNPFSVNIVLMKSQSVTIPEE